MLSIIRRHFRSFVNGCPNATKLETRHAATSKAFTDVSALRSLAPRTPSLRPPRHPNPLHSFFPLLPSLLVYRCHRRIPCFNPFAGRSHRYALASLVMRSAPQLSCFDLSSSVLCYNQLVILLLDPGVAQADGVHVRP